MNTKLLRFIVPELILALLLLLLVAIASSVRPSSNVSAAASVCRAAMVLDRSGSVGPTNLETMRRQILRLFEPPKWTPQTPNGGLYNDKISLAFWSFSNTPVGNYDAPFHGFVSSKSGNVLGGSTYNSSVNGSGSFNQQLASVMSSGSTNYEQGFGYNNGIPNRLDNFDTIVNSSDLIVFMTDGLPNSPGQGNGNQTAVNAAREAVKKLKAQGKIIVGGIIGSASQASLDYVINGPATNRDSDATQIFKISENYNDLAIKLGNTIGDQCDDILQQEPVKEYSLVPSVSSSNTVVTGNDSATFSYKVTNTTTADSSNPTNWSIKRILVNRNQSVGPLLFGTSPNCGYSASNSVQYCDNLSSECAGLLAIINGQGRCDEIASGQRMFSSGATSLDNDAVVATNVQLGDDWSVGTKACYMLMLKEPTQSQPPVNRYSRAVCLIVGNRPLVQVHGGDLKVGRHFLSDTNLDASPAVNSCDLSSLASVKTSLVRKASGKTYGSWAEYAVFAPGRVEGLASQAGLEGGYEAGFSDAQTFWNRLTLANTDNQFGCFTPSLTGMGTIPNMRDALVTGKRAVRNLTTGTFDLNGTDIVSGLYVKETGNLNIESSTLQKNKSVIIYVLDGSITISGNLLYSNGPYSDINEIPQLILMAKRIIIREAVTQVSAWLITDEKSDGTVLTCDKSPPLTINDCDNQLTIDGPIMARYIDLRRTASGEGGSAGDPAEILNLPADAYLWLQVAGSNSARAQTSFTTELPPYY